MNAIVEDADLPGPLTRVGISPTGDACLDNGTAGDWGRVKGGQATAAVEPSHGVWGRAWGGFVPNPALSQC